MTQLLGAGATRKLASGDWPGPTCYWERNARTIRVAYATRRHDGLSWMYPSKSPEDGGLWRELTVSGHPAVASTPDPPWHCTVTVGLADNVSVEVSRVGRADNGADDVCTQAELTAELVVTELKKRAGR